LKKRQMPKKEWEKLYKEKLAVYKGSLRPEAAQEVARLDALAEKMSQAQGMPQMPAREPSDESRNFRTPIEQHKYEASLYRREAAFKNAHPEEAKLLGRFKTSPEQQEAQLKLLDDLVKIGGVKPHAEGLNLPHIEEQREGIVRALHTITKEPRSEVRAELNKLNEKRREHVRNLQNISSGTGEHNQDPVMAMFNWGLDPEARKRILRPVKNDNHGIDYKKNIQNMMLMPAVASVVGDVVEHKISGKKAADGTAWDKIMDLQLAMERHRDNPDRDRIAVKVKDIFKQHAQDLGKSYRLEGASYEHAMEAITDAIVRDKLHAQAVAEMLDNKKIVIFGKDDADFGDAKDVKQQLQLLIAKYNGKTGEKEVYKKAPFTKETLAATFKGIPEEEKPFFTMLFPPGVLEKAGVPIDQVQKFREEGRQGFVDALTDMTRVTLDMGSDELRKQGIKSKQIEALEAMKHDFRNADMDGDAGEYVRANMRDVTRTIRNIAASAKKPGEMWKEFVARKESAEHTEMASKTPVEHATRESGDEMHAR
jgi:hypothetical protein